MSSGRKSPLRVSILDAVRKLSGSGKTPKPSDKVKTVKTDPTEHWIMLKDGQYDFVDRKFNVVSQVNPVELTQKLEKGFEPVCV